MEVGELSDPAVLFHALRSSGRGREVSQRVRRRVLAKLKPLNVDSGPPERFRAGGSDVSALTLSSAESPTGTGHHDDPERRLLLEPVHYLADVRLEL